jgi:hypothetical protein
MADDPNPYAPPRTEAWTRVGLDETALAAARLALTAHLADPVAMAQDRKARWSPPFSLAGLAWCAASTVLIAFVLWAFGLYGGVVIEITGFCVFFMIFTPSWLLVSRRPRTPVAAQQAWLRALDMNQTSLARVLVAPHARGPAANPLLPQDRARAKPRAMALAERLFPMWTTFIMIIPPRVVELGRDGDVALCRVHLRHRMVPERVLAWTVLGLITSPPFCFVPGFLATLIGGRGRTLVFDRYLLLGANGQWYLLDGGLELGADG